MKFLSHAKNNSNYHMAIKHAKMTTIGLYKGKTCKTVCGKIVKPTKKALLIEIHTPATWVPKSAILSEYDEEFGEKQSFKIELWFFKRE